MAIDVAPIAPPAGWQGYAQDAGTGVLRGREAECAQIDGLLDGARQGRSAVLVVRGEAGIGKSALLGHAIAAAGPMPVLRASGLEPESELAFAGLHQLLRPVLRRLGGLPGPQAEAVGRAFGLAEGPIGNPFLVALATLTLLSEVAERNGVLCVIDDAHWLDRSSADALVSVARRLDAEGVVLLMAARSGDRRDLRAGRLPELDLGGLSTEAAGALLDERAGGELAADVRGQLLSVAHGNPLALLELPASLTPEQLAGLRPLTEPLPVGDGVERAFLGRAEQLSGDAQALLLVAAADDTGRVLTVSRAAASLGLDTDALDELEEAKLLRVDGPSIGFRHPLVRSAAYRGAISRDRGRAHLALAAVLGAEGDTARSAWHRAAAAQGPDEALARDLDDAATEAARRGAHAAAAAASERAAGLTADDEARGLRLFAAAQSSWRSGRTERVLMLLDQARPLLRAPGDRAAEAQLHGSCEIEGGALADGFELLVAGAREASATEPARALEMLVRAAEASWWSGRREWGDRVSVLAAQVPEGTDRRQAVDVALLVGSAHILRDEFEEGAAHLALVPSASVLPADPHLLVAAASAAVYRGDEAAAHLGYSRAAELLRARGAIGELPHVLGLTAAMELNQGRLGAATANAAESMRLACETRQETHRCYVLGLLAMIAALRGREAECRAQAAEALSGATTRELGTAAGQATWALGRLELGLGHPAEALTHLSMLGHPGRDLPAPLVALFATQDLVEAAVRSGRPELAEEPLGHYERWGAAVQSASAMAIAARLRALVTSGREADALFEAAITAQEALRHPFDLARTRLLHGEQLRRTRRRLAARDQLRAALTAFEALGAAGWAERARTELRASGETSRRASSFPTTELTPQELQIARFVSEGASNGDVAAKLFVSRRTVEHHLSKVFAKLGISSRGELARALAGSREQQRPAT